jgi:hypothetical protein
LKGGVFLKINDPSKDQKGEIPPCNIRIDREGRWFYQGVEIIREDIIQHFYSHLELDEKGRIIINLNGEKCWIEVEDAPFVIKKVIYIPAESEEGESFRLLLNDGKEERLDPDTIWIGNGNVPYCRVRGGVFLARFSRNAYYELARYIEAESPEGDNYYITIGGRRYYLKTEPKNLEDKGNDLY